MAVIYHKIVSGIAGSVLLALLCGQALAAEEPAIGHEWARFLTEDPETADQYLASIARGKNGTLKILMGKLPK